MWFVLSHVRHISRLVTRTAESAGRSVGITSRSPLMDVDRRDEVELDEAPFGASWSNWSAGDLLVVDA